MGIVVFGGGGVAVTLQCSRTFTVKGVVDMLGVRETI